MYSVQGDERLLYIRWDDWMFNEIDNKNRYRLLIRNPSHWEGWGGWFDQKISKLENWSLFTQANQFHKNFVGYTLTHILFMYK